MLSRFICAQDLCMQLWYWLPPRKMNMTITARNGMHSLNGYKLLKRSLQNEEREVCTLKGYLLLNINPYLYYCTSSIYDFGLHHSSSYKLILAKILFWSSHKIVIKYVEYKVLTMVIN